MPLVVFLVPGRNGVVRRGDMVFQVAELEGGKWKPRWMAHTGIAERTVEDFYVHQAAMVIHMGSHISRDVWSGGVTEEDVRVDACGSYPGMDDLTSPKKARERGIVGSLKPFRWNPAGNQSRPVEPDQQPEASLAWWVGDHPYEA